MYIIQPSYLLVHSPFIPTLRPETFALAGIYTVSFASGSSQAPHCSQVAKSVLAAMLSIRIILENVREPEVVYII